MAIHTEQIGHAFISNVDIAPARRSVNQLQGNYSVQNFNESISRASVDLIAGFFIGITLTARDWFKNTRTDELIDDPFSEVFLLEDQTEGGFVVTSFTYPGATGQGETEDEAIKDIQDAIELLKEEEMNPSGDVEWPMEFR